MKDNIPIRDIGKSCIISVRQVEGEITRAKRICCNDNCRRTIPKGHMVSEFLFIFTPDRYSYIKAKDGKATLIRHFCDACTLRIRSIYTIRIYKNKPTQEPAPLQFRFKTEIEFEKEFGCDWRSKTQHSFAHDMDYLLGSKITFSKYNGIPRGYNRIDGWSISIDMITSVLPVGIKNELLPASVYSVYVPKTSSNIITTSNIEDNLNVTINPDLLKRKQIILNTEN